MKLFQNPVADWENHMTEEDIKQMEAEGIDVTDLRAKLAANKQKEEEMQRKEKEKRDSFKNPTALDKLNPYARTPRSMDTPFFKAVAGNPPFLFKDRWMKKYTQAPLVYAAVVQANTDLWTPGNNDYYPAVFVFALDDKHIRNTEWLVKLAKDIYELQDSMSVPGDCAKLIDTLRDQSSEFCFPVGKSLSGGADAWCATYKFDKQTSLPRKALPSNRIVPFLVKAQPVENRFVDFKLIPAEFYIG